MACEGLGVKAVGVKSQSNDFLGQLIECGIAEAVRLHGLQMHVEPQGVVERRLG